MLQLLLALSIGTQPPDIAKVTADQKKEFLALVKKLPARGEFFTDEGIEKASPFLHVLLALDKQDINENHYFALLALSRGLHDARKEHREYATKHFAKIGHPVIKVGWGLLLFESPREKSAEVTHYLRGSLDDRERSTLIRGMLGPGFEEFRERLVKAAGIGKGTRIELVKRHAVTAFPDYGGGSGYSNESCIFGPAQLILAVRPSKQRGELYSHSLADGKTTRLTIPQPPGFKAQFDFVSYFDDPILSTNTAGDVFCRWTIGGNGDHALALLKKGSDSFLVRRVSLYLANCSVVAGPDGSWYLLNWPGSANFTVYEVDKELHLKRLGSFAGKGHHSVRILDARFISKDVLHLFWADVLSGNHLRMRCVDFDVRRQKWLHNREIFRLDKFVSSANEPTVLQLKDESLHYLWSIDEGERRGEDTGLYCQAEADGKTVKVAGACQYRAIAVGDRIVLCYALEGSPEKVFFRVSHHGTLGPESKIEVAKGRNLWSEYMLLHSEGDRIWFVNTLAANTVYELKLADAK